MWDELLGGVMQAMGGGGGSSGGGTYGTTHNPVSLNPINVASTGVNFGEIFGSIQDGNSQTTGYSVPLASRLTGQIDAPMGLSSALTVSNPMPLLIIFALLGFFLLKKRG